MPSDNSSPDDFCSTSHAASVLGVSTKTIQIWVENGTLQAWKTPGGHRRVTKKSMHRLLEQRLKSAAVPLIVVPPSTPQFELLVIDDDDHTRRLYELTIAHWGLPMRLVTAKDGYEGLIRIGEHKPNVLITDLKMPGMDGYRVIEALRNDPKYESIHIVVVSGISPAEIRHGGFFPGDIPVFPKPIPFDSLRLAVEDLLIQS